MVTRPPDLEVLEHEKGLAFRLSAAQRSGDACARGREGRQAVGFRREVVELRAVVDL
jgi:hypothetical protein